MYSQLYAFLVVFSPFSHGALLYNPPLSFLLIARCYKYCEALEEGTEELGDVEQLMKNLKV